MMKRYYLLSSLLLLVIFSNDGANAFSVGPSTLTTLLTPTAATTNAASSPFHPSPDDGQVQSSLQLNSTSDDSSNSNKSTLSSGGEGIQNGLVQFLWYLFNGLAAPFPSLRKLASRKGTKQDSSNEDEEASSGAKKKTLALGLSVKECLFAIVAYLGIGVVAWHQVEEQWSLVDALYFSVVSFTTVGYGDICPTNAISKIMTCVYGLTGIVSLAVAISTIGSSIVQAEVEAIRRAQKASRRRIMHVFEGKRNGRGGNNNKGSANKDTKATAASGGSLGGANDYLASISHETNSTTAASAKEENGNDTLGNIMMRLVPSLALLLIGGIGIGRLEGWSRFDSIYYSLITASTVGYGDYSPQTRSGRLWAVCFIPLAVAAAGEVLSGIASLFTDRREKKVYEQLVGRELSLEYLDDMDVNRDGKVSRSEYVQFMLVQMGVVQKEQFAELSQQFERLDASNSGYLDKEDLKDMAKREKVKS